MLAKQDDANLNKVPESFRSADGLWIGTSGRSRVLVYNTNNVKEDDLPNSVMELTDAKWKAKVGWVPTNASFQSFVAAMIEIEGEEATKKWLEGMVANEPKVYPKNTPAVAATGAGEVDVALVNHYYLFRLKKEKGDDFPAANHFFKNEKAGQLVNVSGLSTLKSTKNPDAAKAFVEYVLSEEGQNYFAQETYEYPVVAGIKTYETLPALEAIRPPKVDFAKLANLETTIRLLRETKALK
jgi:iron(III) transport system substrate-binding protein